MLYGSVQNSVRGLGSEPHRCSQELAVNALLELSPTTHNLDFYSDLSYGMMSVDHVRWRRGGIRRTYYCRDIFVKI